MPRVALLTVGDTARLTGGYLYHARVIAGLRERGLSVDQLSVCAAELAAQLAAASRFGAAFDPARYDVVIVDALARGVYGSHIAAWQARRPVVALVHQLPSIAETAPALVRAEAEREAPLLGADRLIAVSEHGRQLLIERGVPAGRIAVISPGFDRLPAPPADDSSQLDAGQPLRVLCVAQWIPRKGITTLLEAWRRLAPPDAVLELIGERSADPPYAAEVDALLEALPAGAVRVHGAVDDTALSAAYRRAHLFALPSRFEGYGMVYAEALAHGLPVVACMVGPVPALITPEAGIVVPPDDPGALAEALGRLLGDSALRARLAAGARRRAAALPSWSAAADSFERLILDVIAARAIRAG